MKAHSALVSLQSRQMLWNFGILTGAITLMAAAFRQAKGESEMLHLMVSVLFSMVLPVILTCESVVEARPVNSKTSRPTSNDTLSTGVG